MNTENSNVRDYAYNTSSAFAVWEQCENCGEDNLIVSFVFTPDMIAALKTIEEYTVPVIGSPLPVLLTSLSDSLQQVAENIRNLN